jgi:DNA-binding MarR family transcriptional regulator
MPFLKTSQSTASPASKKTARAPKAQWMPLNKLFSGQASSVAELARQCRLDTGAMTRMLDRLEAKGLCQRVRSESDRRVVRIALADAGVQAAQDIPRVLCGVQNAHLLGFIAQEFDTLKTYLRRILANAQSAALQALPSEASAGSAALASEIFPTPDSGDSHGV